MLLTLLCVVVGITDGDTLTARCTEPQSRTITIRLAEIDAPEKRQPFGERSRQHLAQLCFKQSAKFSLGKADRYGRTVARVTCNGLDANAEQVRAGMAWAYTSYLTDQRIAELERDAKRARRGLWIDPSPTPPWTWRRSASARSVSARCDGPPPWRATCFCRAP